MSERESERVEREGGRSDKRRERVSVWREEREEKEREG